LTPGYPIEEYRFVPTGISESRRPTVAVSSAIRIQPNPFARAGSASYSLPRSGNVSLKLYDAAGRTVLTLVNGYRRAGAYSTPFQLPAQFARGIYCCRLEGDGFSAFTKLVKSD
jgi:hypothetical protein